MISGCISSVVVINHFLPLPSWIMRRFTVLLFLFLIFCAAFACLFRSEDACISLPFYPSLSPCSIEVHHTWDIYQMDSRCIGSCLHTSSLFPLHLILKKVLDCPTDYILSALSTVLFWHMDGIHSLTKTKTGHLPYHSNILLYESNILVPLMMAATQLLKISTYYTNSIFLDLIWLHLFS